MSYSKNPNLKDLYEKDIEKFKNLRFSMAEETWLFLIIETSKIINKLISEFRDIKSADLEYHFISLFRKINALIDNLNSNKNSFLSNQQDLMETLSSICDDIIFIKYNDEPPKKSILLKVRNKLPSYDQSDYFELVKYFYLLPITVLKFYRDNYRDSPSTPNVSKLIHIFNPLQIPIVFKKIQSQARSAQDLIISTHLNYVVWYSFKYKDMGLSYIDVIQAGNIGLLRAFKNYDILEGVRFKTYAYYWIRQTITRTIADQSRTIRFPVHLHDSIVNLEVEYSKYKKEHMEEPTLENLAKMCEEEKEEIQRMIKLRRKPLSLEDMRECEDHLVTYVNDNQQKNRLPCCPNCNKNSCYEYFTNDKLIYKDSTPICLDPSLNNFEQHSSVSPYLLERLFCDSGLDQILNKINTEMLVDKYKKVAERLTFRERDILRKRFGLNNEKSYTLEELGEVYDVTRERIRQIEYRALNEVRKELVYFNELKAKGIDYEKNFGNYCY